MASSDLWWVYLLARSDDRFYVGMSRDPGQRLRQHQHGKAARFTRGQPDIRIVGAVPIGTRSEAGRFERQAKRWRTERKLAFFGPFANAWSRHKQSSALDSDGMQALQLALVEQDVTLRQLIAARQVVMNSLTVAAPELLECIHNAGLDDHACCEWLCCPNAALGTSPAEAVASNGSTEVLAWILRTIHAIPTDPTTTHGLGTVPVACARPDSAITDSIHLGRED